MDRKQARAAIVAAFETFFNAGFAAAGGDVPALAEAAAHSGDEAQPPSQFRIVLNFDPQHGGWHGVYQTP